MDFSKLTNLYNAQQKLDAYKTNAKKRTDEQTKMADINGDGKIDSKDKKLINEALKEAKAQNLFDFNGDDKVDVNDWLLFSTNMDLDGDGELSPSEKKFLESQEKTFKKAVKKSVINEKYTGEFDGKMYNNGKLLTGLNNTDGKYYKNGVLLNGSITVKETDKNGKTKRVLYYYQNGEKANGNIQNSYYKDGLPFTGLADNGLYYTKGKPKTGTEENGHTSTYYKNGKMQYTITDNNETSYPNASGQTIKFQNSKLKLEIGSSAVINKDGTVEVTDKDGNQTVYDKTGNIKTNEIVTLPGGHNQSPSIEKPNIELPNEFSTLPGGQNQFQLPKDEPDEPTGIIGKDGAPIRYENLETLLKKAPNAENARVIKNEDGTCSVTIYDSGIYLGGSVPSVTYDFDIDGNLLSYTHHHGFDESTSTTQHIYYDQNGAMVGGTIKTRDKTIQLPAGAHVSISPPIVEGNGYFYEGSIIVSYDSVCERYDLDGTYMGKETKLHTDKPKATVGLSYDSNELLVSGKINFDNGQTFEVPAGARVSFANGKIYVDVDYIRSVFGDNGFEYKEPIVTIDPSEPAEPIDDPITHICI